MGAYALKFKLKWKFYFWKTSEELKAKQNKKKEKFAEK